MRRVRPTSRWALWVFAAALLLKSAMPILANASAQWRGVALVEVCTVYGVAKVAVGDEPHGAPLESASDHGGDHCALTGLSVCAGPTGFAAAPVPRGSVEAICPTQDRSCASADACARWAARLEHGPPRFS